MIAIDINTNKAYHSKYARRIADKIGADENTVYKWIEKGLKMKVWNNRYLIYIDTEYL